MSLDNIERKTLIRGLGLVAAISIIIGNVIGTGVFLKARVMTCNVGSPTWVMVAWVAAGLLSLAGALTYAELTAMKPEAAGPYAFLRDSYGKLSSFLFGWMQSFIARTGSQAGVAVVFAIALNDYLDGGLKQTLFKTNVLGYDYEVTSLQIIAVAVIAIFTTLNCLSVSLSGQIATWLTTIKIALVLFVGLGAFFLVTGGSFANFSLMNTGGTCEGVAEAVKFGSAEYTFLGGFGAAMLAALWGYDGWDNLSFVAGEVKDPNRNIPIAIIGSVLLVIVLYVFASAAYFYVLDPTAIASVSKDSSVAKVVVSKFFSGDALSFGVGVAVAIFTVGLMLSSLGTLHTSILSSSRIPYAMAKDGLMFKPFSKLSVNSVPINGVLFQGVWASILAMSGSFDALTDYVIFGSWIFYALITSSIFLFRRKYPDAPRPYRAWGYPVVPVIFLLVSGWLLINTMITAPTQSFIGIGLILLGLPVYYFLTLTGKKTSEEES
ncbi:MAG: amino acid permease [Pyrinomonadaceae bacterium]|nr:amino acid permease [Acidobacteriota bacterium]MBP7375272.1 amino acid permease [Pyrinomonadaceae bacterium]